MSTIDASTTSVGGVIQLYVYEPFSNQFVAAEFSTIDATASDVTLQPYIFTNPSSTTITFSSDQNTFNFPTSTTNLPQLVIQNTADSNDFLRYSVRVGAGRFLTPASNTTFTFSKDQPIVPQPFTTPIPIQTPVAIPALPVGLTFSNIDGVFNLVGKPLLQGPTTTSKIIGRGSSDPSKIITVDVNFSIGPEVLYLDSNGSTTIPLSINQAVTPRTITARVPPYPLIGNNVRYTWSTLPDGLKFTDLNGTEKFSGFIPTDTSSTIVLAGTPTLNAALNAPSSGIIKVQLNAIRTTPSPNISNFITFDLSFGQQVLFNVCNVASVFFNGLSITSSPSSNSIYAYTKFGDASINDIWSSNLAPGMSLVFISNEQRAYITGTPSSNTGGPVSFRVYGSNANGFSNYTDITYSVSNDVVRFQTPTPSIDTCVNFIIGRSAESTKTDYYNAPIDFKAVADSGCNVTLTTSDLIGTGLSLSNVGSNTYRIVGIPDTTKTLGILNVTGTCAATSTTKDTSLNFAIVPDILTFPSNTFSFIQNKAITSYDFNVQTLSGRSIIGFSSANLPTGLTLSSSGILSGTPESIGSGTFNVSAFTGFQTDVCGYPFTTSTDAILLTANPQSSTYTDSEPVSIQIKGLTFSGKKVTNYMLSNIPVSYGLTINSNTGLISGVLTDSVPPNPILPPVYNFYVSAKAGTFDGSVNATIVTTNPIVSRRYVMYLPSSNTQLFANDTSGTTWSNVVTQDISGSISFVRKNNILDSNVLIYTGTANSVLSRSTNGNNFGTILYGTDAYTSAVTTDSSNWWMIGRQGDFSYIFTSYNDGLTWSTGNPIYINDVTRFYTRDSNQVTTNPYLSGGAALAYRNGLLMLGGSTMARTADFGDSWFSVTNGFQQETAYFSLDVSLMWIATGSDDYTTLNPSTPHTTNTNTIKYSIDDGNTWLNATGGFNHMGYEVVHGSGGWLATGVNYAGGYVPQLRYSTDGPTWNVLDLSTNALFTPSVTPPVAPMQIGPIGYDGTNWNVFVTRLSNTTYISELYTSPSLTGTWSVQNITSNFGVLDSNSRFVNFLPPTLVRAGNSTSSTITINTLVPNAVTFTSPVQTSYIFYQYMNITPIKITATGVGTIYYFVDKDTLPLGLVFDPVTQEITGKPMHLGDGSITIYAKDDSGVTQITLTTTTIVARIVKKQTSAGGYTSLIRQYTEVNAAQNARDARALPTQNKNLGEFQSPYKSDAVTQSNCPKCEP